ncbi:MAG TPA: helix-turn-helix transcriptional regulator [Candidatus Angelobacter sp.]|jgi:ribosome-binding protein aMBF1 (putative translation factor)|nr:helix-turn-helix transcriptional regulator [Candidatus Angelobacter sp.]
MTKALFKKTVALTTPRTDRKENAKPIQKALGERIRKLRIDKALSQTALAELSGLSPSYIGEIERGEHDIGVSTLKAVARALDTEGSRLFEGIA